MDSKAKIEEMLRLKREGARAEKPCEPEQPKQPLQALQNEQHGTVMDRINSMLKQKQAQTDEPAPPVVVPPAPTQPEEVVAIVQRPPEVDLQSTASIEAALNEGNAAFYYGGFIGGQNQEQPTPRRRRRR